MRSDTVIGVTVTVDRPDPSVAAECLVFAQAVTYDRVGETGVRVEPGGTGLTTMSVESAPSSGRPLLRWSHAVGGLTEVG